MKEVFAKTTDGTYYLTRRFVFMEYCEGTLIWLDWVYQTYLDTPDGPKYVVDYPYDPRRIA